MKFIYQVEKAKFHLYGHDFVYDQVTEVDAKAVAYRKRHPDPAKDRDIMVIDKLRGNPLFRETRGDQNRVS
ncbi:MAG: hypothetical protein ACR2QU_09565 [Gammaproteobacteria bacterium]